MLQKQPTDESIANFRNGSWLADQIVNRTFSTSVGNVTFDRNGERGPLLVTTSFYDPILDRFTVPCHVNYTYSVPLWIKLHSFALSFLNWLLANVLCLSKHVYRLFSSRIFEKRHFVGQRWGRYRGTGPAVCRPASQFVVTPDRRPCAENPVRTARNSQWKWLHRVKIKTINSNWATFQCNNNSTIDSNHVAL